MNTQKLMEKKERRIELYPATLFGCFLLVATCLGWSGYLQYQMYQMRQNLVKEEQNQKISSLEMLVSSAHIYIRVT